MKRVKRKLRQPKTQVLDLFDMRIRWIDRVVAALDSLPGVPNGMDIAPKCRELRASLLTFRDGVVLGSRLPRAFKDRT